MINLTQILNTDSIASLYLTINGNNTDIQTALNELLAYVDTTNRRIIVSDGNISPTYSIELDGTNGKITTDLLEVNTSLQVDGTSTFSNTINATEINTSGAGSFNGGLTATSANVYKSLNLPTSVNVNVFSSGYFVGGSGVFPTNNSTFQTSNIFLNYATCTTGTNDRFLLGAGLQGQIITVTLTGLVAGTTAGFIDITGTNGSPVIAVAGSGTKISLNYVNSCVTLRYDTTKWYLIHGNGFTIV